MQKSLKRTLLSILHINILCLSVSSAFIVSQKLTEPQIPAIMILKVMNRKVYKVYVSLNITVGYWLPCFVKYFSNFLLVANGNVKSKAMFRIIVHVCAWFQNCFTTSLFPEARVLLLQLQVLWLPRSPESGFTQTRT